MKTKRYSIKLLIPLTGSICGLFAVAALVPLGAISQAYAGDTRTSRTSKYPGREPQPEPRGPVRSPEEAFDKGLEYLLWQQHGDGGWGQGGGWRQNNAQGGGRVEGVNVDDPSDLGNTCVSLVTLLRTGDLAAKNAQRVAKAFDYICDEVERADKKSLYVTDVRDTQLQVKIGSYVDTFLAGWALSEFKGKLPDEAAETRRAACLEKVVSKIERNQRDDGSYADNKGWAAVLSQGLASTALNSASRSGAKVSKQALDKDQAQNKAGLDLAKGDFSAPTATAEPSSAGVSLYREAAKLGGLREKSKSNVARKKEAEKTIANASAPEPAKAVAQQELKEIAEDEKAAQVATTGISSKLRDSRYVGGFGNNGGEEFLSYMNLTESMHAKGGQDWQDWREQMTKTICGAQNADGSWAGQHCITGRTFCTATALLALLVEKAPDARVSSATPGNPTTAAAQ